MLLAKQESSDQIVRSDGIDCRHDDLREGTTDGNLVWSLCLDPIDPLSFHGFEAKVKEAIPLRSQHSLELERIGILFLELNSDLHFE